MGINLSFFTHSCVDLNCQLNQVNLLALDYDKISPSGQSQIYETQYYQHCYTKNTYKLQTFHFDNKYSLPLSRALKKLQFIKNNHISNVIFSEVNIKLTNLITKHSSVKIFSEHSFLNLSRFITQKGVQFKNEIESSFDNDFYLMNFTNIEIANFIHSITGIASEISSFCLPVRIIDPEDFMIMDNQNGKIRYSLQFDRILTPTDNLDQKGYFSPELFTSINEKQPLLDLNQSVWQQNYQKNLIFGLGMAIVHYLLMQECDDCYNYKSGAFCQSEMEKKLLKISKLLFERLMDKEEDQQIFKQSRISEGFSTKTHCDSHQNSFQVILYELIMGMTCQDPEKRISVKQLRLSSRRLMQKVHQQIIVNFQTQPIQTVTGVFQKIKRQKPLITCSDTSIKELFLESIPLKMKKTLSNNDTNTTDSIVQESRTKKGIRQLRSKKMKIKQKSLMIESFLTNKQNIPSQNITYEGRDKSLKGNLKKLSGHHKAKPSDHSLMKSHLKDEKVGRLIMIQNKSGYR